MKEKNIELRDYFAIRILQSLILIEDSTTTYDEDIVQAYSVADKMLRLR